MTWTGFYVGLNVGGTWGDNHVARFAAAGLVEDPLWLPATPFALSATGVASGNTGSGFIGGGQIGYNYQLASFLVGLEADIQGVAGSSGRAQAFGAVFNPLTGSTAATSTQISRSLELHRHGARPSWLALHADAARLWNGRFRLWRNVPLTISQASFDDQGFFGPAFGTASVNPTSTGWTAGGGLEWMFWPNWSAKVEYLYYDLGPVSATLGPVSGLNFTVFAVPGSLGFANLTNVSTRVTGNIVRAGVNYHFNWGAPAPILAKY